jgi:hypothetical protein
VTHTFLIHFTPVDGIDWANAFKRQQIIHPFMKFFASFAAQRRKKFFFMNASENEKIVL